MTPSRVKFGAGEDPEGLNLFTGPEQLDERKAQS